MYVLVSLISTQSQIQITYVRIRKSSLHSICLVSTEMRGKIVLVTICIIMYNKLVDQDLKLIYVEYLQLL